MPRCAPRSSRRPLAYAHLNLRFFVHALDPVDVTGTAMRIHSCSRTHDGLIVTCPSNPATTEAIGTVAAHRPVITLATDVPGSGRHAHVGPDDRKAGRVAAALLGRLIGPPGGGGADDRRPASA